METKSDDRLTEGPNAASSSNVLTLEHQAATGTTGKLRRASINQEPDIMSVHSESPIYDRSIQDEATTGSLFTPQGVPPVSAVARSSTPTPSGEHVLPIGFQGPSPVVQAAQEGPIGFQGPSPPAPPPPLPIWPPQARPAPIGFQGPSPSPPPPPPIGPPLAQIAPIGFQDCSTPAPAAAPLAQLAPIGLQGPLPPARRWPPPAAPAPIGFQPASIGSQGPDLKVSILIGLYILEVNQIYRVRMSLMRL